MKTSALYVSLICASLGLVVSGCCGGGDGTKCQSELTFDGTNASGEDPFRGWGTGKTEAEARKNSCWDYCRNADTDFDAKHAISVDAMKKKGVKIIPRKADWHRFDKPLKDAHKKCVDRCTSKTEKSKGGFSTEIECGVVPKEPDYARKRREARRPIKKIKKIKKSKKGKRDRGE